MMPLSAVWAGPEGNAHLGGAPLLYATTEDHTPFRLVTHQGDVGHTLVVGPTGAGKSVLLNLLSMQFKRYPNAQVSPCEGLMILMRWLGRLNGLAVCLHLKASMSRRRLKIQFGPLCKALRARRKSSARSQASQL